MGEHRPTAEEVLERQEVHTATWEAAQRSLADPQVQARVRAQRAKQDAMPWPRAPEDLMTGDEFAAQFRVRKTAPRAG